MLTILINAILMLKKEKKIKKKKKRPWPYTAVSTVLYEIFFLIITGSVQTLVLIPWY